MLSLVAGILENGAGARVVVGSRDSIRENTDKGERAFIVPGYLVSEPVPREQWGVVVGTAMRHMKTALDAESACGGCRACCKTMRIDALNKREHVLCVFSSDMVGCKVHSTKPHDCRVFECLWLKSQRRNDRMSQDLRPDRCGVIFTEDTLKPRNPDRIEAHEDHDTGVTNVPAVQRFVDDMIKFGKTVEKITHYHGAHL